MYQLLKNILAEMTKEQRIDLLSNLNEKAAAATDMLPFR